MKTENHEEYIKRPVEQNGLTYFLCLWFIEHKAELEGSILRSDTTWKIALFLLECFLRHYEWQLKTAVEKEAAEKIDCKR